MLLNTQQLHDVEELNVDLAGPECNMPSEIGSFVTPIHLDLRIRKVKEKIAITGRLTTTIAMLCARCLRPHNESISESFEVVYYPSPETERKNEEIELTASDLDVSYYTDEVISISDLARDQCLLCLPVQPLCTPDCAGLCPLCGKDLNAGPCECSKDEPDPRLAVLKQLLRK